MNFYKKSKVTNHIYKSRYDANNLKECMRWLEEAAAEILNRLNDPSDTYTDTSFENLNERWKRFGEKLVLIPTPITIEPPLPISYDTYNLFKSFKKIIQK